MKASIKLLGILCILSCSQFKRNNPADPGGVNYIPPLLPVQGLRIVAVSFDYVDLAWNPYPNALNYEIFRYRNVGAAAEISKVINTAGYIDHDIQPQTQYFYRVIAVVQNQQVTSPCEPLEVVTTAAPPIHLSYPSGGEVLPVGQHIIIEWKVYDPVVSAVRVQLSIDNGATWENLHVGPIDKLTRSLGWTPLPRHVSANCIMAVSDFDNAEIRSHSDVFSIVL